MVYKQEQIEDGSKWQDVQQLQLKTYSELQLEPYVVS